ncbi:lytic murein transglycosylase [Rubellimicrobium thermophilum DSM 16684]|uniref:Lytic murein transglycosylase n=1 Tax=Rubellimicrobium thermophilum DSM 16684 TaxID=1123069 RepID=S9SAN8_9RHOB|nr:lytic murein transglycosylase [Rubellimicrobium thermophilum]EPX83329.1 lytic murein transglycosylase [Rubellimicrobium thermophilum DSM 16684]
MATPRAAAEEGVTRRALIAGVGMGLLAACGARRGGMGLPPGQAAQANPWIAVPDPGYDVWVRAFLPRARAAGIPEATLNAAFAQAGFIPEVIARDRNQAEFRRSLSDYLLTAVSDARVEMGQQALRRHAGTLARIEARYGVEAPVVAAIWGIESTYGTRRGDVPVISALSTLAYEGRRASFFEDQLIAALRILARGDVSPAAMKGSWAGAMGHTQFIPTSFEAYAVDFDGDGRRDIWSDDPTDALASTAAYLSRHGWRRGEPWGRFGTGGTGGRVIQPDGAGGPAFRVFHNFDVIRRYNSSDSYAIAVGHLSDRLQGRPPLPGLFSSERPLTLAERIELQERLTARGFDTGGTDGTIGPRTIQAIRDFQTSRGMAPTGFAEPSVLQALR